MANLPEDAAIAIVFKAIALSEKLSDEWILKGGNALKQVFRSPRASVDLDFTEVQTFSNDREEVLKEFLDEVSQELDKNLGQLTGKSEFEDLLVQSRKVKPPNVDLRDDPAFEIKVGYSKRSDRHPPYSDVVKLEITLNDIVCENQPHKVNGGEIRVCSLNDIIAEKLRSLIQQKTRDRYRPNDVFDIWFYHKNLVELFNYEKISSFLKEKSKMKFDVELVRKYTFISDKEIRERAQEGFDNLEERVAPDTDFPTFEEAFNEVLKVVKQLSIPD